MTPHSYSLDSQTKSTELAGKLLAAVTPPEISAIISAVELHLIRHSADQNRHFFSLAFPTLISKLFGFSDDAVSPSQKPPSWIDAAASSDDDLAGKLFAFLSSRGTLISSIFAVDKLSLVKYVFPVERLPEWFRFTLNCTKDCQILNDLCRLFRGRVKEDEIVKGSYQFQDGDVEMVSHDFLPRHHPETEIDNPDSFPPAPSLDEVCESMASTNSIDNTEPVPTIPETSQSDIPQNYYPIVYPTYVSPFYPYTIPLWPGYNPEPTKDTHEVVKPTAVHTTNPVNVDELIGMSKLSVGDTIGSGEQSSLSKKLLEGSSRQCAFQVNPVSSTSGMNSPSILYMPSKVMSQVSGVRFSSEISRFAV